MVVSCLESKELEFLFVFFYCCGDGGGILSLLSGREFLRGEFWGIRGGGIGDLVGECWGVRDGGIGDLEGEILWGTRCMHWRFRGGILREIGGAHV